MRVSLEAVPRATASGGVASRHEWGERVSIAPFSATILATGLWTLTRELQGAYGGVVPGAPGDREDHSTGAFCLRGKISVCSTKHDFGNMDFFLS